MNVCKLTRLDHFRTAKNLVSWLEDHGLPVATKDSHPSDHHQVNINTMQVATGGKVGGN